uniref:(northern house mosquito) hypothetical protein n=1 Tax=Culex pipiens TaxID=7175 RepID=A0A8D8L5U6_CULPI
MISGRGRQSIRDHISAGDQRGQLLPSMGSDDAGTRAEHATDATLRHVQRSRSGMSQAWLRGKHLRRSCLLSRECHVAASTDAVAANVLRNNIAWKGRRGWRSCVLVQ